VYALIASLSFSGAQTAHFSFDMTLESFLEGHVSVFNWLGGVPRECVYDNLRSVVAKRDCRRGVRWNQRFLHLRGHYAFHSTACTPSTPREKGSADFMFQLTREEAAALRSQSATSNTGRGGRRYAPYVFTEQGVAMLSGVLRSKTAVAVNIAIMRAFVELRRAATSYATIQKRREDLERETQTKLGRHDHQLEAIFAALRQLINPPPRRRRPIGFNPPEADR
jgi:hypothetical protein